MLIILIIAIPVVLAILIILPEIIKFVKYLYKDRTLSEDEPEIIDFKQKFDENTKFNIPISDLEKQPVFLLHSFKKIVRYISFLVLFPIALFRMALMIRFGSAITWRLPFNFYEIWLILIISLSYYYSYKGLILLGVILASFVLISIISLMITDFETEAGEIKLQKLPKHKIHLSSLVEYAVIITLCFAAFYYSSALYNVGAFSEPLSIFNSIYFSVITITTIGYGDIIPTHWISRSLVMIQSLFGFLFIVIFVSVFVNIWRDKKGTTSKD